MLRPLKPKSPADASTPTPPAELVKGLTSQRDSRALAASSTAIALSIAGPAFYDTHDTFSDGTTVWGQDAGWKTAYAAVKMAVEITKESCDMLPPLRAAVGAMSALMKNYDVSMYYLRTEHLTNVLCLPSKYRIMRRV